MAEHIHAIRQALIECGLLPEVTDYKNDPNHSRNYSVAWHVQYSLLGRGFGVSMTKDKPLVGMRGRPIPPVAAVSGDSSEETRDA